MSKAAGKKYEVKVGGKKVNLSDLFPLKWKDAKELQRLGVDDEKLASGNLEVVENLVIYLLNRAGADITPDVLDDMDVAEIKRVMTIFQEAAQQEVDRPT